MYVPKTYIIKVVHANYIEVIKLDLNEGLSKYKYG